ncbi:hypothetical protein OG563_26355 [Nocardia vinacea]|uniref:Alternate-type signal peptide domain-containing protein n=1 Tax=Nocardia vinacea TaxID=96468 RepID=A0ABZ1YLX7_9NOCA|nr:hypothetical protein [Nocardia vinacea]
MLSLSTTAIAKASVGSTAIQKISLGTTLLWSAVTFVPVSAKLNATYATATSYAQVTGWAADTTAYPGSTVSSNKLVIPAAGTGVTLSCSIPFSGASGYAYDLTLRLVLDGTVIATGTKATAAAYGTATATVSIAGQSVNAGSLLMVEALGGSPIFGTPTLNADTNSFLRAIIP